MIIAQWWSLLMRPRTRAQCLNIRGEGRWFGFLMELAWIFALECWFYRLRVAVVELWRWWCIKKRVWGWSIRTRKDTIAWEMMPGPLNLSRCRTLRISVRPTFLRPNFQPLIDGISSLCVLFKADHYSVHFIIVFCPEFFYAVSRRFAVVAEKTLRFGFGAKEDWDRSKCDKFEWGWNKIYYSAFQVLT